MGQPNKWIDPERLTHMIGKKEKKNKKEEVPFHIKWGWLGDGKDWRNSALVLTFLFNIVGVIWYPTERPPWRWSQTTKNWRVCEQYYP